MIVRATPALVVVLVAVLSASRAGGQGFPDLTTAKDIDRCSALIQRTGAKLAVKKLKSLFKCTDGILKCIETKPDVPRCREQARERCEEQLRAGTAAEASLVDAVARKCGSDLTRDALVDPLGLDVASLEDDCVARFGIPLTDLTSVGRCLARRHACELERLVAVAAPRAAGLLAAVGVDPAARAALTCLTDRGGADEHVADARNVGRPLERCARAVDNAALKLVDATLRDVGKCVGLLFTCVQVKRDPAAAPACNAKAEKRCAVEIANVEAAAARVGPALASACGALDADVLRSPEGLRLAALDTECAAVGGVAPLTLADYADCLVRTHRCGVVELARSESPRADALLARIGTSLGGLLCPALAPSPTATVPGPSATPTPTAANATPTVAGSPTATAVAPTATGPTPTATGPTASPTPSCADAYEPGAFPAPAADVTGACGAGGCTEDGFSIVVNGTIDVPTDDDFYVVDVTDLPGGHFALQAQLTDVPHGTNLDLFLYRFDGAQYVLLDSSTNDGTGSETVRRSADGDGESGRYGVEVRGVGGASCSAYRLEIEHPS